MGLNLVKTINLAYKDYVKRRDAGEYEVELEPRSIHYHPTTTPRSQSMTTQSSSPKTSERPISTKDTQVRCSKNKAKSEQSQNKVKKGKL